MESNYKLPLGQVEKGEELKKIEEKAVDNEVVHKSGLMNEEVDGVKTFKSAPKSQSPALTDQELIRLKELNLIVGDLAPLEDVLLLSNVNQTVDGVKTFKKSPKSNIDASSPNELVRYSQYTTDLESKADDDNVMHLNDIDETVKGTKTFEKSPRSLVAATADNDLVRKKEFDTKADESSINDKTITLKVGTQTIASFTLNQEIDESFDFESFIPEVVDVLTSTATNKALSANQGKELKNLIDGLENSVSSGLNLVDGYDASTQTNFPGASSASKGDTWVIENSGVIHDEELENGDMIIARENNASETNPDDWIFIQKNIDNASELVSGYIKIATQAEVDAGIDDEKAITSAKLNATLGVLAKKDKVGTPEIKNNAVTPEKLDKTYVEEAPGKSLIDDTDIDKLQNIEQGAQKNVQADYAELDEELDSFIKNKEDYITLTDEFYFSTGDTQKFNLTNELHKIIDVKVNGQGLVSPQWNEWYNMIEILDTLEDKDTVSVTYETPTDYSRIHGYRYDVTVPAQEVERIGNLAIATELPIQKGMKGCLLLDDGTVNYWLDENDWSLKDDQTPSDLSGADGQVVVRIPRYWLKQYRRGDIDTVLFSDKPFKGAQEIQEAYIGAYKASLDRGANKLSSVVNNTPNFRGGNNQSAWDTENDFKNQLGKPTTVKSRGEFRQAAQNRGSNWFNIKYEVHQSLALLPTYEFGTRNHQSAISEGPTNLSSTKWDDFNSRYPLFKCGLTNSIGNGTGEVTIDLSAHDLGANQTQVFRYRGIENSYGDIFEWMSGVNILNNKYYITKGYKESDSDVDGYKMIGDRPTSNGYIQEMHEGTLLPAINSGSSATYFTDYLYSNDSSTLRGLLRSAHAHYGAHAGSFFLNSRTEPSHTYSYFGSRLCFLRR